MAPKLEIVRVKRSFTASFFVAAIQHSLWIPLWNFRHHHDYYFNIASIERLRLHHQLEVQAIFCLQECGNGLKFMTKMCETFISKSWTKLLDAPLTKYVFHDFLKLMIFLKYTWLTRFMPASRDNLIIYHFPLMPLIFVWNSPLFDCLWAKLL